MIPNLSSIFSQSFRDTSGKYCDHFSEKEIELLFEHRLFKCYLPESLGGLSLSLPQTLQVIEDASYVNGSLGWLVQIGNGGMYFATNFVEETTLKLFSPKDSVIAGSGTPTTTALKVDGGYRVSGSWRFCSGSAYASLFTLTFYSDKQQTILSAVVPRSVVTVHNDWDTIGMRNTSTNSISVEDIFIPDAHTFKVTERKSLFNEPVLGLPFILYAQSFFIHVVYGIFNRMLQEAENLLEQKKVEWELKNPVRIERLATAITIGKLQLHNSKELTMSFVQRLIEPKNALNEENERRLQRDFTRIAKTIRAQAHELYCILGIDVIYCKHPIAVCYLDLISASQHKLLTD